MPQLMQLRRFGRPSCVSLPGLPSGSLGYSIRMVVSLSSDDAAVAPVVRKTAAWSWRLLIIAVAAWVLLQFLMRLGVVIVPAALALMLTALLVPAVDFLDRRGAPRGGAVALVLSAAWPSSGRSWPSSSPSSPPGYLTWRTR